jgi:TolB-like protein
MPDLKQLIREVHRRSLWQVLGIYVVGGWIVLQAADTLAGALNLPDWAPSLALFLLIIGLPIVLATAFVQEGMSRGHTPPDASGAGGDPESADGGPAATSPPPRQLFTWRNVGIAGVVSFAAWGLVSAAWLGLGMGEGEPDRRSIAILPFANLSGDGAAYFANGIHEDVLLHVARIADLKVISRTSVMEYRGPDRNIREIADELGVATILEGSVQQDTQTNRVRVTAQLIDAVTDQHLWADQYDRQLADVFEIQSAIAFEIAEALRATLTTDEERRIEAEPTRNPAAYDLVLRGRELYATGAAENDMALELFRQAARIDPGYAEAHAWLSSAYRQRVQIGGYDRRIWRDSAEAAARLAVSLDPQSAVAQWALGSATSGEEARQALQRAVELNPNWRTPLINLSADDWFNGRCAEGIVWAEKAREVDPLDPWPASHMSDHNVCLGRLEHADRWIEETRRLSPDWYFLSLSEAWVRLAQGRYGDLAADADQFLSRDGDDAFGLWYAGEAALYLGELEEAEARWTRLLELSPMWSFAAGAARLRASLVYVRRELGQPERTDALIEEGVRWAEEEVEAGRGPDYPYSLAMLHAVAGRSEESLGWLTIPWDH